MAYVNKTQPTKISPKAHLEKNYAGKEGIHSDALALVEVYEKVTGSSCIMWNNIFGFGKYTYKDSKGGEHEHLMTGFAISSTGFTLYNMTGWEVYKKELKNLGKYKLSGKSCLAIKSVKDIDVKILKEIVKKSLEYMKKTYKTDIML